MPLCTGYFINQVLEAVYDAETPEQKVAAVEAALLALRADAREDQRRELVHALDAAVGDAVARQDLNAVIRLMPQISRLPEDARMALAARVEQGFTPDAFTREVKCA